MQRDEKRTNGASAPGTPSSSNGGAPAPASSSAASTSAATAPARPRARLVKPEERKYTKQREEELAAQQRRAAAAAAQSSFAMVGGSGARKPSQLLQRGADPAAGRFGRTIVLSDSSDEDASTGEAARIKARKAQQEKERQKLQSSKLEPKGEPGASSAAAAMQLDAAASSSSKLEIKPQPLAAPLPIPPPATTAPLPATAAPPSIGAPEDNICLGVIQATLLCMDGLPAQITFQPTLEGQGNAAFEDVDPAYSKALWPNQTAFWAEAGFRAAVLELVPTSAHNAMVQQERDRIAAAGGKGAAVPSNMSNVMRAAQEIKVSVVIPPTLSRNAARDLSVRTVEKEPFFGVVAEKYCSVLDPLLRVGKLKLESRVPMASNTRAHIAVSSALLLLVSLLVAGC